MNKLETGSQTQRTDCWSPEGRGTGDWVKKAMGLKVQIVSYKIITNRDVKYSTGNRVNNIVISMYGAGWGHIRGNTLYSVCLSNHHALHLN